MQSAVLERAIEKLSTGPRAQWAPPPPIAVASGLAEQPGVLFVGWSIPEWLAHPLTREGWQILCAPTLRDARRELCGAHFSMIIADAEVPDGDVVVWTMALKAGHAIASGVPMAASGLPVVLLAPVGEQCAVAVTSTGSAAEIPAHNVVWTVLRLLSE